MSIRASAFELKLAALKPAERDTAHLLSRAEHLRPAALAELTRANLRATLRHAASTVPYYRELFADRGLTAERLAEPGVLAEIPLLSKDQVRENFDSLRAEGPGSRGAKTWRTGGSTGEPLRIMHPAVAHHRALNWRLERWWGATRNDNIARIWRQKPVARHRRLAQHALWWPVRECLLDASAIDADAARRFVAEMWSLRPALLIGYVGGVLEFARLVDELDLELPPLRGVEVAAAPVTPGQRAYMAEVLGAPVFELYSCTEVPILAAECPSGSLHVQSDVRVLELLDEDNRPVAPGQPGRVVVTDLLNRAFPLIRYDLGDVAREVSGACVCGRPFPRLSPVTGRVSDALPLPSGRTIAGESLCSLFNSHPEAVRQFQVVQRRDRSLLLRCVPGSDGRFAEALQQAESMLRGMARGEVAVAVEVVDSIAHDRGKTRFIVREDPLPAVPDQAVPGQADATSRTSPVSTS